MVLSPAQGLGFQGQNLLCSQASSRRFYEKVSQEELSCSSWIRERRHHSWPRLRQNEGGLLRGGIASPKDKLLERGINRSEDQVHGHGQSSVFKARTRKQAGRIHLKSEKSFLRSLTDKLFSLKKCPGSQTHQIRVTDLNTQELFRWFWCPDSGTHLEKGIFHSVSSLVQHPEAVFKGPGFEGVKHS